MISLEFDMNKMYQVMNLYNINYSKTTFGAGVWRSVDVGGWFEGWEGGG